MSTAKISIDSITVAIPTFGREQVLLETVRHVLQLQPPPEEVLVIDQTPDHEPDTTCRLEEWHAAGTVRWLRLERPSIPAAMNHALREGRCPLVLFLDDDLIPQAGLIAAHQRNYAEPNVCAVVGQVLQPGQVPSPANGRPRGEGLRRDLEFHFAGIERGPVANVMAGNLSVRRDFALQAGGFDENFVGVAYRFETEFCRRLIRKGGAVLFEPAASIHHLAAPRGGTRTYGRHLTSARPEHSVGDYYFALLEGTPSEAWRYALGRLFRSVRTRFHFTHPWWIPVKLVSEVRGFCWAWRLKRRGPQYVTGEP